MPERYAHDGDNFEEENGEQLDNETDIILGAAENAQSQSLNDEHHMTPEVIQSHIDTVRNSMQQTDLGPLKSESNPIDGEEEMVQLSLSDRTSPQITKPMDAVHLEPEQVMSSAQTLEADQQISEQQVQQPVKQR